tara:strand:- start:407 stop:994 length:588 start_codon:yes stop_codon:yes gene_type:complete
MRLNSFRTACVVALFTLTACVTAGPQPSYPEITFSHLPPIELKVAEIVYEPRYQPPIAAPNIGHEFPTPPAKAVERWISDRLKAVGTVGQAKIVIRRATGTETKLKVTKGLTGAFITEQAWRYDAHVEVAIEAVDPNRKITAQASAAAQQSRTMPEDASLSEREDIWFALTETVMRKFNTAFEAQIRKDLAKLIK